MTARTQSVVDFYNREADDLARMYDSVDFDVVHPDILELLPQRGARILDVGSGSGRDALALAAMGFVVVAAEPSNNLRTHATNLDRGRKILWLDDRLPALTGTKSLNIEFDFILCSAVLMLVSHKDLRESFASIAAVLASNARVVVTLRSPTGSSRDSLFVEHTTEELKRCAAEAGLVLKQMSEAKDALGRSQLNWRTFVWQKVI